MGESEAKAETSLEDQGNEFFKAGNYLKAAALYTQAIKKDPSNATLYSNRAAAFQRREQEYQSRELERRRALVVMSQELTDARTCLMRLDATLDEQINTLRVASPSSKAMLIESYVLTSKRIIREEVEKAKGGAGPSTS